MTVAFISILSLLSIFVYDFCTQSSYFKIKQIVITGTDRVQKDEILSLAALNGDENIFDINLYTIEKQVTAHPWIQSAKVSRSLKAVLHIAIIEQKPLAIVKIENLADILINTQGTPFKEYNPSKDRIDDLPVISGLDLSKRNDRFMFYGPLFNSVFDLLTNETIAGPVHIKANPQTGLTVEVTDTYNMKEANRIQSMLLKLGFNDFKAKLAKARLLSKYIDKNFPDRTIVTMDLFNIHKVFIKTRNNDALHTTIEKGV